MERYSVITSEPAEKDLYGIFRYIAVNLASPKTALDMIGRIRKATRSLSNMPLRYALVTDEELAQQGFRTVVVKNYLIIFKVNEDKKEVHVSRVVYGGRDWGGLL